jgi:GNAT superfamily N-acetyltransferase
MDFTYRLIRPDEEATAVTFWSTMFEYDYDEMHAEYATDPDRLSQTYLAVDLNGQIAATASYCVRLVRDNAGEPQRTGCVWNVATAPQFQRRGLARRLMHIIIDAMIVNGCSWSLLFTSRDGRSLYSQLQYTELKSSYWEGKLVHHVLHNEGYDIQTYDPRNTPTGWASLHDIYHSYNEKRPLTTVRDLPYWHSGYAHYRYSLWLAQRKVIVAAFSKANQQQPVAYLAADFEEDRFQIFELGATEGHEIALASLISRAIQMAIHQGHSHGRVWVPHDHSSKQLISSFFERPQQNQEAHIMGRSLLANKERLFNETIHSVDAAQWMIDNV